MTYVMKQVLVEGLEDKTYDGEEATELVQSLANEIKDKIRGGILSFL